MSDRPASRVRIRWGVGWVVAVGVSALLGSLPARGAVAADCASGDYVRMIDPVVIVIDGPGDLAEEQARWSALEYAYLEGPLTIALGNSLFDLDGAP